MQVVIKHEKKMLNFTKINAEQHYYTIPLYCHLWYCHVFKHLMIVYYKGKEKQTPTLLVGVLTVTISTERNLAISPKIINAQSHQFNF